MKSPQIPSHSDSVESDTETYDEFLKNLEIAHTHAQKALDILYQPGGVKRSFFYRSLLGRAQSILIGLYVQEVMRKGDN